MVLSLRKWVSRFKLLFFVILFSIILYRILGIVSAWVEPPDRYKEPAGKAVKAFRSTGDEFGGSVAERLKFFYWYGE